jgi:Uma2 family endonuclease
MATRPDRRIVDPDEILNLDIPDGLLGYEFVDGELVPVMPASRIHARLTVEVAYRLRRHVDEAGLPGEVLGDAGVVLGLRRDQKRMRAPDVAYISSARLEGTDPERLLRVIPEFAIEIDITSGKKPHGSQRIADYLEAGISLVWAIDPHNRTATAYRLGGPTRGYQGDDVLDAGDVVPGFRLRLSELFD